jgi:glycerophosphoryl diester phosphodiesterase
MFKSLSIYLALSLFSIVSFAQISSDTTLRVAKANFREAKRQARLSKQTSRKNMQSAPAPKEMIMPENTLEGMFRALDLGVEVLEMDVVISKDKQVLLAPEPFMQSASVRTPSGTDIPFKDERKHNIYAMEYAKVKQYDVGSKKVSAFPGQEKYKAHAPLLIEVLEQAELYAKQKGLAKPEFCIEFRMIPQGDEVFHPAPAEFVDLVMGICKS